MEAALATNMGLQAGARRFHLWMALVFMAIAFGGFVPTYWAPVARGAFNAPPAAHVHGFLLFAWTLFYLLQVTWVASGRVARHRAMGLAGIALFSLVIASIVVLKIAMMRVEDAQGYGDASRRFAAVAIGFLPLMVGLFALAIARTSQPETHRRLMFVLMCGLMVPALARLFLVFVVPLIAPPGAAGGGPPPAFVVIPPTVVASLLIVAGMVHDKRTRGRVHRAYAWGLVALLGTAGLIPLLANTSAWMGVARFLEGLGG
jgi:hypothetical protein